MNIRKILAAVFFVVPFYLSAQENNSGCTILRHDTHAKIEGNKRIRTETVEMMLTDMRGEEFTTFNFDYSKGDKLTVNYAHITDMNGNIIRKLKNSEIQERQYMPGSTLYHDQFIKYFTIRHNVYPYKICYSVSHTQQRFMHLGYIAPYGRRDIKKGSYTVEVPVGFRLKYLSENLEEPRQERDEKNERYVWDFSYKYWKEEENQSAASKENPFLMVLPEKFYFGVPGDFDSWENFGEWAWRLNEGLDILPESEKLKIDELVAGVEDDREKVRILYHYLQDYNRYVNVSVKLGGLKSYPAEYVCRNRFGDCKALCNYMKAILKHAGIEAYYTLAYLDEEVPVFYEDFPNNAFNHIITVVPLQKDTVYLECTSKNLPFNYPSTHNQGRKALVTKQKGSHLIDVPAMTAEETACTYHYTIDCPDDRSSSIGLEARLKGSEFEMFNSFASAVNKNDVEQYMRRRILGGTFVMGSYNIDKPGRDSTWLTMKMEGSNGGFYRVFGSLATIQQVSLYLPPYETPDKRRTAVQLDLPQDDTIIIDYNISGVEIGRLPNDIEIESAYGNYWVHFEKHPDGLTVTKKLNVKANIIPIEEYPAFYDFVSRVRTQEALKYQIEIL